MKRMGLAQLLYPLSVERFLSTYWQKKPYAAHGKLERFEGLDRIPELASIDAILEAWGGTADAWAPRDTKNPVITAEPQQLSAFYESGYTLYLSRIEDYVPALEPLARQMELDLGLRFSDVFFEGFVSKGTGSALHFDPNVSINIQLIGRKHWKIAENKHLVNPHMGWSVGADIPELMLEYARQPFPATMPRGARNIEARPGTMIYLPPGYWHSTINREPSLSIVYTVQPPSWAELLVDEIRNQLQLMDAGRELAFGLGSAHFQDGNRRRVEALLGEIGQAAARMDPGRLLAGWGDSLMAKFEKNPDAAYRTEVVEHRGEVRFVLKILSGRKTKSIDLPPEAATVLKWVAARKRPFDGHEAASAIHRASPGLVIEILAELEAAGLIARLS